jgi:iron(III) transport system substrate-binding protein
MRGDNVAIPVALAALLALLMVSLPLLAACTPPSPAPGSPESPLTYRGPDRAERLARGAAAEGRVSLYTNMAGPIIQAITTGFQRRHPGIKLDIFRANSDELGARIAAEMQARRPGFDVLIFNHWGIQALRDGGTVAPYFSPAVAAYPESARGQANGDLVTSVLIAQTYVGFGYNRASLRPEDVPRTYRDLLNPALRGKMAVFAGDTALRLIGTILHHEGEEVVRRLGEQDVTLHAVAGPAMVDLIASGEVVASPAAYRSHVHSAAARGAPVDWVPLEPVSTGSAGVGAANGAAHPHAAALLIDFLLDEDGRAIFEQVGYGSPARDPGFKLWDAERGLDEAEYHRRLARWEQLLKLHILRR